MDKIHCYQCKTGRPKPDGKYRCIVEGWDKQKEVNATDTCEKGEEYEPGNAVQSKTLQRLQTTN